MTQSVLDDVPGLGPTRRTRLLKEFGSVKKLRDAAEDELLALPWLPDAVGRDVYDRLTAVCTVRALRRMGSVAMD